MRTGEVMDRDEDENRADADLIIDERTCMVCVFAHGSVASLLPVVLTSLASFYQYHSLVQSMPIIPSVSQPRQLSEMVQAAQTNMGQLILKLALKYDRIWFVFEGVPHNASAPG